MGLYVSHNAYQGSYTGFSRMRLEIIKAAGYPIREYETEFGYKWKYADLDWESFSRGNLYGKWVDVPDDPLLILIAHHDHDGRIYREHCGILAARLEEVIPLIEDEYWRKTAYTFLEGLKAAHFLNEPLTFG